MGIFDFLGDLGSGRATSSPLAKWERDSNIKLSCQQQLPVSVTIDEHVIEPISLFIEARPDKGWIIIDNLVPEEGNNYIKKSESIRISYRVDNIGYNFKSAYIDHIQKDGYPALKIAYPQEIKTQQRRKFFRVEPPIEEPVNVTIKTNSAVPLHIERDLRDLSEGGLSFAIKISESFHLDIKKGKELEEIHFTLPDYGPIKISGIIRGIFRSEGENLICGVEFSEIKDSDMSKIYRYVVDRQRDALKKLKV